MSLEYATAYLALGGNIGNVRQTFSSACNAIAALPETKLITKSSLYRTPPWGVTDQPDFLNACIAIETALSPEELMRHLLEIEQQHGRKRNSQRRWHPRTLDIDLIAYGDVVRSAAGLSLPHPFLFDRAFVLIPLAQIAGNAVIAGRRIKDAAAQCGSAGITRLAEAY